ncbi:hypothetical protein BH09BAC3_BH09BAC3_37580 [soil metagenome]
MKKSIAILCLVALAFACEPKKSEVPNQLTEAQTKDGWKLLFDGKSLDGWRIFKGKENDTWEVADGTIHCKPVSEASSKRSDLMTTEQYQNFELVFDWKIPTGANSGVIYHVTEEYDLPYASGPEYQIIDDAGYPGGVEPKNQTASNYDVDVPSENKKVNPIGEWNTSKIMINNNKVEHWINGEKVVSYEFGTDQWKEKVAGSKWKEFPGYGLSPTGYIDLQDHGHEIWFRNIMIKSL